MATALPTGANITGLYSFFQYVQLISDDWFFILILFGIFVIMFISMKAYSSSKAFITSSFFCMILAILLRTIGFISNKWMYLLIIMVALGVAWNHITNSQS